MLNYRIVFEKHGALRRENGLMKNEVWLDVGNFLGMGYFDHHQVEGCPSTLHAVVENLHFLDELRESARRQETIIVHMHEEPDLDCVASYYAVRYCLEHSEAEIQAFFGEQGKGRILERYVNDIDSGLKKITDYPTLYAIFSLLDAGREKSGETDCYVVDRGLELLSGALEELSSDDVDLATYDFSRRFGESFANEIQLICNTAYEENKKNNVIRSEQISVWTKDGNIAEVPAAIWEEIPKSYNEYNYARKEGSIITIVPYAIKGKDGSDTTRVFASVNPDIDAEKRYTLRPIAEIIEQMEQIEEQKLFEKDGTYRRDHSRPREASGHLGKMPFAATSDPWFVKPEEDLFDAPRVQSILNYEDILEVIRNNGSAVKKSYAVELGLGLHLPGERQEREAAGLFENTNPESKVLYEKHMIPLSTWQEEIKKVLHDASSHVVVWGELDASLIRHSNRILEAYCMNLIGKPLHEENRGSIHFIDYRTCIYSDYDCTVILTATYKGYDPGQMITAGILDTTSGEAFRRSPLPADIAAVVRQRDKLLEYGNEIGELKPKKRKEIEQMNEKILALSLQMQKDDMVEGAVEREIYSFIKNAFNIAELKTATMDELGIIVGESRDRFISRFNVLSAFAVPFVLIATVFQMGFLKFEEVLNLTGCGAVWGWIAVTVLVAALVFMLMGPGGGEGE